MTVEFQAHITRLCKFMQAVISVEEYSLDIVFSEDPHKDDGLITFATIQIDNVYLNMLITIYPPTFRFWEEKQYYKIADTICHEFCHLFIDPVYAGFCDELSKPAYNVLKDNVERQTQRICNTLMDLIPESAWLPRKTRKPKS